MMKRAARFDALLCQTMTTKIIAQKVITEKVIPAKII